MPKHDRGHESVMVCPKETINRGHAVLMSIAAWLSCVCVGFLDTPKRIMSDTTLPDDPGFGVFHAGELQAHSRYGVARLTRGLAATVRDRLNPALIRFLQAQPFFFMATANDQGACDCSFRGRQHNPPNDPEPLLVVPDEHTLIFPDYPGNNFFNSIGNLFTNPQIGMLFVDFSTATRVRINGRARVLDELGEHRQTWPTAERLIEVTVQQAYPNCRARVPRLAPVTGPDFGP